MAPPMAKKVPVAPILEYKLDFLSSKQGKQNSTTVKIRVSEVKKTPRNSQNTNKNRHLGLKKESQNRACRRGNGLFALFSPKKKPALFENNKKEYDFPHRWCHKVWAGGDPPLHIRKGPPHSEQIPLQNELCCTENRVFDRKPGFSPKTRRMHRKSSFRLETTIFTQNIQNASKI